MPEGGVKLKNLTGYTTYMISVAPFNAAGDGPRSPPTRGRTQQAGIQIGTHKYSYSARWRGCRCWCSLGVFPNVDDSTATAKQPQPSCVQLSSLYISRFLVFSIHTHRRKNKVAAAGMRAGGSRNTVELVSYPDSSQRLFVF